MAATDCPDCGGGEPLGAAAAVFLLSLLVLVVGGAAAGGVLLDKTLFRQADGRVQKLFAHPAMLAIPIALSLFVAGWLVVRERQQSTIDGDVLVESNGIRYRAGPEWSGGPTGSLSLDEMHSFDRFSLFWLGFEFEGYNLRFAQQSADDSFMFGYGVCGPAPCTTPQVSIHKWCSVPPQFAAGTAPGDTLPSGAFVRRSADGGLTVLTADVSVALHSPGDAPTAEAMLAALMPVGGGELPAQFVRAC